MITDISHKLPLASQRRPGRCFARLSGAHAEWVNPHPQSETRLLESARGASDQGFVPCALFWVATEVGVTVGAASPINSTSALAGGADGSTVPVTPFRNHRFPD
jgi:hypothetical protein